MDVAGVYCGVVRGVVCVPIFTGIISRTVVACLAGRGVAVYRVGRWVNDSFFVVCVVWDIYYNTVCAVADMAICCARSAQA